MIPKHLITEWRKNHPWPLDNQVEQDLLISRVLVELFSDPQIAQSLAFRGGTALYKLFLTPAPRYSEDIDLVQVRPEPIGPTIDRIRRILDPLLGLPARRLGQGVSTITYRFKSEDMPLINLRLKLEINTREHGSVLGFMQKLLPVDSSWFSGEASIPTYQLEELMGTKLRALYQRKKGRDLFDIWFVLSQLRLDIEKVLSVFLNCIEHQSLKISRAEFERNLHQKAHSEVFLNDTPPLLRPEIADNWNPKRALQVVQDEIVCQLIGDPWNGQIVAR